MQNNNTREWEIHSSSIFSIHYIFLILKKQMIKIIKPTKIFNKSLLLLFVRGRHRDQLKPIKKKIQQKIYTHWKCQTIEAQDDL